MRHRQQRLLPLLVLLPLPLLPSISLQSM
jgi:hypothetical protein